MDDKIKEKMVAVDDILATVKSIAQEGLEEMGEELNEISALDLIKQALHYFELIAEEGDL